MDGLRAEFRFGWQTGDPWGVSRLDLSRIKFDTLMKGASR